MPEDRKLFMRRLVILGVLVIALLVCLIIYGVRSNQYAFIQAPESFTPKLTNPEVLQNWLPPSSYKYTIARIYDYLRTNNLEVSYMTVQGKATINQSTLNSYDFTLLIEPQDQTHHIAVSVDNFSGVISTAMSVDGQQQNNSVSTQGTTGTQYSGISNLVSVGVTALQADELQTAFQKFLPTAQNITISPSSIVLPSLNPNNPSLTTTYRFSVNIDDTSYQAKFNCIGLNEIELFLSNSKTGTQVFDSGIISSQG